MTLPRDVAKRAYAIGQSGQCARCGENPCFTGLPTSRDYHNMRHEMEDIKEALRLERERTANLRRDKEKRQTVKPRLCQQQDPMGNGCIGSRWVGGNYGHPVCNNPDHHAETPTPPTYDDLVESLRSVVNAQIDIDLGRAPDCLARETALDRASELLARLR